VKWVKGGSPWVSSKDAARILGISHTKLLRKMETAPEYRAAFHMHNGRFHIAELWEVARWCSSEDVIRWLGISDRSVKHLVRIGAIRGRRYVNSMSDFFVPYEDVLRMKLWFRVRRLIRPKAWRGLPWKTVWAWVALGPDAVKLEAARQGVKNLGKR